MSRIKNSLQFIIYKYIFLFFGAPLIVAFIILKLLLYFGHSSLSETDILNCIIIFAVQLILMFIVIDILFRLKIIGPINKFADSLENFNIEDPKFNIEGVTFNSNEFNRIKFALINNAVQLQKQKIENESVHEKNNKMLSEKEKKLSTLLNELKDAQVALITEEKISSSKVILSSVSHELKNPINIAMNSTHVLVDLLKESPSNDVTTKVKLMLDNILKSHNKMVNIIETMLITDNLGADKKENINLSQKVQTSYKDALSVANIDGADIKFECNVDENIEIEGFKLELNRLFINIFQNSIYAIKKRNQKDPIIKVTTKEQDSKFVISILDNGIGIKEEHLEKVFIPFFSTKPNGEGVGLGLHFIKEVIKQHKGELEVSSVYNDHTKINIKLPIESVHNK